VPLLKKATSSLIARSTVGWAGQWQRLSTAIAKLPTVHSQLLRKDGSMSAVALGVGLGSLAHRGWHPSSTVVSDPQLRQSYITPHFRKCRAVVALKLHLVPGTAARPNGFPKQALCKIAYAGPGLSAACTPQPLHVLRAVACRPCGVLAPGYQSGALRIVLVSGFAVYLVCAPAHPWSLLASQQRPRGLPVRPPRGLPQNREQIYLNLQKINYPPNA